MRYVLKQHVFRFRCAESDRDIRLEIPDVQDRPSEESPSMSKREYTMRKSRFPPSATSYSDHTQQLPLKASCIIASYPLSANQENTTRRIRSSYPAPGTASQSESSRQKKRSGSDAACILHGSITKFAAPCAESLQGCQMKITRHPWERLPTIWNIVDGLAGLRLGDVREVACQSVKGAGDVVGVRRLR